MDLKLFIQQDLFYHMHMVCTITCFSNNIKYNVRVLFKGYFSILMHFTIKKGFIGYNKDWTNSHRRLPGTGFLFILEIRRLNLMQIYCVLIPILIPMIPILLAKLFFIPSIASFPTITVLTLYFFSYSGFSDVLLLSSLLRLLQLQAWRI